MFYSGIVVHGEKRGRALGYPTANVSLSDETLSGVYAGRVEFRGEKYIAALFADRGRRILEAHLLDFNDDMYDQEIRIEVFKKIRDYIRFDSDQLLKSRIKKDIQLIREHFKEL